MRRRAQRTNGRRGRRGQGLQADRVHSLVPVVFISHPLALSHAKDASSVRPRAGTTQGAAPAATRVREASTHGLKAFAASAVSAVSTPETRVCAALVSGVIDPRSRLACTFLRRPPTVCARMTVVRAVCSRVNSPRPRFQTSPAATEGTLRLVPSDPVASPDRIRASTWRAAHEPE